MSRVDTPATRSTRTVIKWWQRIEALEAEKGLDRRFGHLAPCTWGVAENTVGKM